MVYYHSHSRINCCLPSVHLARRSSDGFYERCKKICVVTRIFGLQHHSQPLQAQACVYMLGRQILKETRSQAVILYEDQVPQFDHLWVIFIHKFLTRHLLSDCFWSNVYMNLCTRTTRARITHLPKIIPLGMRQYSFSCYVLLPNSSGLVIGSQLVLVISPKNGYIKSLLRQLIHCSQ